MGRNNTYGTSNRERPHKKPQDLGTLWVAECYVCHKEFTYQPQSNVGLFCCTQHYYDYQRALGALGLNPNMAIRTLEPKLKKLKRKKRNEM